MTSFVLKIIAMVTMFCDHLGYAIFEKFSYLNYIGRLAFPLYAFGISEGYKHTSSKKNYLYRLTIFAIISQAPFMLFYSIFKQNFTLNIFFTLLLGLIAIIGYEKCSNKYVGVLLVACIANTAEFLHMDYGWYGILMIFIFHIFKDKKLWMNISYIALTLFKYVPLFLTHNLYYAYILLFICTLVPLIFINLYNGKKGVDTKHILYGFYPLHLMILYVINVIFI